MVGAFGKRKKMATIGNVNVSLGGDASGFLSAMGSVAGSLTSVVGKIVKIGSIITGALTGLAGLTFGVLIKNVSDLGDELLNVSTKTGIAVETLSSLKLAATLNEAEFGDLTAGLKLMQRNLSNADEEGQAARQTLLDLGFTAADIASGMKDSAGFLESFAQKIAAIDEPAKRVGAAMAVMGRGGTALIPLLLDIANRGMAGLRKESDLLGNTFSTKLAVASDNFGDNLTRLKAAIMGTIRTAIGPMVVALTAMSEQFLKSDMFAAIQKSFAEFTKAGVFEAFAKSFVLGFVNVIAKGAQFIADAFDVVVTVSFNAFNSMARGAQIGAGAMFIFFGTIRDSIAQVLEILPTILTVGAVLQAAIGNVPAAAALGVMAVGVIHNMDSMRAAVQNFGTGMDASMAKATHSLAQFNAGGGAQIPKSFEVVSEKLHTMADGVSKFSLQATKGFDQVAASVQRAGNEAPEFNMEVTASRNAAGEIVTSFTQIPAAINNATGQAEGLSRVFETIKQQIRDINANPVKPVA